MNIRERMAATITKQKENLFIGIMVVILAIQMMNYAKLDEWYDKYKEGANITNTKTDMDTIRFDDLKNTFNDLFVKLGLELPDLGYDEVEYGTQ